MKEREWAMLAGEILEGRYRILAEGVAQEIGMAHEAVGLPDDRPVTVVVLLHRYGAPEDLLAPLSALQQAVANLKQPAVVPCEHVGLAHGRLYMVRARLAAPSLGDLLQTMGALASHSAVRIALGLCDALAAVHRGGLVHGSLSTESVLVGNDGSVAVVDTGLLPVLRPALGPRGQAWGRFPYLSPEQAAGEDALPASDVYTVGLLLYEMLTGRPPFRTSDERSVAMKHLRQEPTPVQSLAPQVAPRLAQVVHKALAKEPTARYRNAGQLAHILRSQLEPQRAAARREPVPIQLFPASQRLVVPPPPASPSYGADYTNDPRPEIDDWQEEPGGVDWLMIGLIIAALLAVLGLIPLWRTVYRQYAVRPPAPSSLLLWPREDEVPRLRLDAAGGDSSSGRSVVDSRQTGRLQTDPRLSVSPGRPHNRSATSSGHDRMIQPPFLDWRRQCQCQTQSGTG